LKPYATGGNYAKDDTYAKVALCKDGKRYQYRLHRLIAETFIPNPDNLPQVNHKDFNKWNNCVDNLEWCSAKYNMQYNRLKKVKV
jgi:hypothetical protein